MLKRSLLKTLAVYKSFWLIPIVLIFFVSALVSLAQLKQSIAILDDRYGTSVWALFQLKTELRRFNDTLSIYKHSSSEYDQVTDRYDLLWSRFPVLLEGEDAFQLRKIPNAPKTVFEAFQTVKSLEKLVVGELKHDPELSTHIQVTLKPHLIAVDKLALDNYHFNNDFYNRGDQRVAKLQKQLIWLMLGLIASGSLFLLMILKESRINKYQAEHDSLTAMPNRAYLRKELSALCKENSAFALHLIDLNGFKDVNDTLGHHAGDVLLQSVSKRLVNEVDKQFGCITCRMGGDEFAVLHRFYTGEQDLSEVTTQIIKSLESEFTVDDHPCFIGGSVGSVIYPNHGSTASQLLTHADIAMYKAKEFAPTSKQVLFDFEMDATIKRKQQLQRDMREALENNKLTLVFQPIVSLNKKEVCYYEALLRWNHPVYGPLSPIEVIDVAEQYGLGHQLGCWVINESCKQIQQWQAQGVGALPVSVNISPSMYRYDLSSTIKQAISAHQLGSGMLWIEVTEDTTMQSIREANQMLDQLSSEGVSIALDDFGTGLSSLSHLKQMNIQTLKIDRSFIKDIDTNPISRSLVRNIIAIGHDLGMKVVAEGIETEIASQILSEFNCDFGQGYLFSKPLEPDLVPELTITQQAI